MGDFGFGVGICYLAVVCRRKMDGMALQVIGNL